MTSALDNKFFEQTEKFYDSIEPYIKLLEKKDNKEGKRNNKKTDDDIKKVIERKREEFQTIVERLKSVREFISFCDYLSDLLKVKVEEDVKTAEGIRKEIKEDIGELQKTDTSLSKKEIVKMHVSTDLSKLTPWTAKEKKEIIDDIDILKIKSKVLRKWTEKKTCVELFNSEKTAFDPKKFNECIQNKEGLAFVIMNETDVFGCYLNSKVVFDQWIYDEKHFVFSFAQGGELRNTKILPKEKAGLKINQENSEILLEFGNHEKGQIKVSSLKGLGEVVGIQEVYNEITNSTLCEPKFKVEQIVVFELKE